MTPKDKALELVDKYMSVEQTKLSDYSTIYQPKAKQCAIIAVDEVLMALQQGYPTELVLMPIELIEYWQQTKTEIENL
jgi:hypothetical protein